MKPPYSAVRASNKSAVLKRIRCLVAGFVLDQLGNVAFAASTARSASAVFAAAAFQQISLEEGLMTSSDWLRYSCLPLIQRGTTKTGEDMGEDMISIAKAGRQLACYSRISNMTGIS